MKMTFLRRHFWSPKGLAGKSEELHLRAIYRDAWIPLPVEVLAPQELGDYFLYVLVLVVDSVIHLPHFLV